MGPAVDSPFHPLGREFRHELLSDGIEIDGLELREGPRHVQQLEVGNSLSVLFHGQNEGAFAGLFGVDLYLDAQRADCLGDHLRALLEHLSLLAVLNDEPTPAHAIASGLFRYLLRLYNRLTHLFSLGSHRRLRTIRSCG